MGVGPAVTAAINPSDADLERWGWRGAQTPTAFETTRVEVLYLRAEIGRQLRDGEAIICGLDARPVRWALRISRQVLLALGDPHGLQQGALKHAGRQLGYALTGADPTTRQLVLTVVASQAAKNQPIAYRKSATSALATIDALSVAASERWARRGTTTDPLPVETARRTALELVLAQLGIQVKREGRATVALCPLYNDLR